MLKFFLTPRKYAVRVMLTMLLACSLVFAMTTGFVCNNQSPDDKARNVALARDVVNSLQSALPLVTRLNPRAGAELERAVPIANQIINAVEASNAESAVALMRDLLPIINSVVAQFSNNVEVLTILALADIALHFLINHMGPKLLKASRSGTQSSDPIVQFAAKPIWGCQYRADLCPAR